MNTAKIEGNVRRALSAVLHIELGAWPVDRPLEECPEVFMDSLIQLEVVLVLQRELDTPKLNVGPDDFACIASLVAAVSAPRTADMADAHEPVTPADLFSGGGEGFQQQRFNARPWCVRWDRWPERERWALIRSSLPALLGTKTSGSTGSPATWWRTPSQLEAEARLLAALWDGRDVEGVLSYAPPVHAYGTIATVLLPAVLGVPVWFQARADTPVPQQHPSSLGVVALPWTFPLLLRENEFLGRVSQLSVLHSTAGLPSTAAEFLQSIGPGKAMITEAFGSSETGAIAFRRSGAIGTEWSLFSDVAVSDHCGSREEGSEVPLTVTSPRLAAAADGARLPEWRTDDLVVLTADARGFHFTGRRGRLCKVNGVRVDLDQLEAGLRVRLPGVDLACFPVTDPVRGENVIVRVAIEPQALPALSTQIRRAAKEMQVQLGRIDRVDVLKRSVTGKPTALGNTEP